MTSIHDVLAHLDDATSPCEDELVATAERAGAPEGVVKALRAMPPVDCANPDEVARPARTDPVGWAAGWRRREGRPGGVSPLVLVLWIS